MIGCMMHLCDHLCLVDEDLLAGRHSGVASGHYRRTNIGEGPVLEDSEATVISASEPCRS